MSKISEKIILCCNKLGRYWATENYGRHIVVKFAKRALGAVEKPCIVDIGVGEGQDLQGVIKACSDKEIQAIGLDFETDYYPQVPGITYLRCDIENESMPILNASCDLVIANQVLEHTKQLYWIFSNIGCVLKPGGTLIVGVPNMAALHNRILLLLGIQPPCLDVQGAHVRGFCHGSFTTYIELGGYFKVEEVRGSNIQPLPIWLSRKIGWLFPGFAACNIYRITRTDKTTGLFSDILAQNKLQTNYKTYSIPAGKGTGNTNGAVASFASQLVTKQNLMNDGECVGGVLVGRMETKVGS